MALRVGSRGSALALWQANFLRDWLQQHGGLSSELVIIKTSGDRFQKGDVGQIGIKGVFIKELEDALLEHRVDLAVHSMKDVPTGLPAGLIISAIGRREEVRDCLVSRNGAGLAELPKGARVGTSSLRRAAQLSLFRPDLQICELRGNVDTRLRRLDEGQYNAIVLAKAGLDRLGWSNRITEVISTEISLPAVGQGAIGVETREDDREAVAALAAFDHAETRVGVTAERALLAELEGGCQVPLGAWGRVENGELVLEARVLAADGSEHIYDRISGLPPDAARLGKELAQRMLRAGADRILKLTGRSLERK